MPSPISPISPVTSAAYSPPAAPDADPNAELQAAMRKMAMGTFQQGQSKMPDASKLFNKDDDEDDDDADEGDE